MKIQLTQLLLINALLVFLCVLPGCATIVSKTNNRLLIRTDPQGADVTVSDRRGREVFSGKSPTTITVKTGAGYFTPAKYQVKLTMPGYEEKTVTINYTINGWYFGNIFLGGALGMLVVDPATGAMWKVKDPVVDEKLKPSAGISSTGALKIMTINDISENQKKDLVSITK
jgi:hypothetical protein